MLELVKTSEFLGWMIAFLHHKRNMSFGGEEECFGLKVFICSTMLILVLNVMI
jgi:hypothetical protein